MEHKEILENLKKKIYHPVYFLHGDEPYFIDVISDYIENHILTPEQKEFNQTVVYGKDTNASHLISLTRQLPMGAHYQVVIVKEAQDIRDIDKLETYFQKPVPSAILVINYKHKKPDKRKKYYQAVKKNGIAFEAKQVYDDKIPGWITNYLKNKGYSIDIKSAHVLNEFLGNDLGKITNEIDKMLINIPDKKTITLDDIENNVGISKDYNIFELQDALGSRDIESVNKIINYFGANPKEFGAIRVITMLYYFFQKVFLLHFMKNTSDNEIAGKLGVHPFFVKRYKQAARNYPTKKLSVIMDYLRDYDLKAKGVNNASITESELLRELAFRILH